MIVVVMKWTYQIDCSRCTIHLRLKKSHNVWVEISRHLPYGIMIDDDTFASIHQMASHNININMTPPVGSCINWLNLDIRF